MSNSAEADIRTQFVDRITRSERGKLTLKIRTLMELFGYTAMQRVRQSSLSEVLTTLADWGIAHRFPGGISAVDYVTLSLAAAAPNVGGSNAVKQDASPLPAGAAIRAVELQLSLEADPFAFVFEIDDIRDPVRSMAMFADLVAAVWSCSPVCALIEASDEFFAFASGYLSAIMRRRRLMLRRGGDLPIAPTILRLDDLKRISGQAADAAGGPSGFPEFGAAYLVRDQVDDLQDDELVAFVREAFVPNTYRLRSRFFSTAGDVETGKRRAGDEPGFDAVLRWLAMLAGSPELTVSLADGSLIDMAGLFTEACRLRDALLARVILGPTDPDLRAGYESTEHMALKNLAIAQLRARFPGQKVAVEEHVGDEVDDETIGGEGQASPRLRPDLRAEDRVWVEVETMRWACNVGSSPFFELERKLRRKLEAMKAVEEVWIVVPGDVALLAPSQISAVVRNLQEASRSVTFRLAFGDLANRELIFAPPVEVPAMKPRLNASSWRVTRRVTSDVPVTWKDVAGYSSLRAQVTEQVLSPLRDPQRYARHGLSGANGLLLFGLPGCGKSLIGRVLAGEADIVCKRLSPSDLTSKWLGEGVEKIREVFDWALKQTACLLVIDEIDAIAPQRSDLNMHADEKRQVNELLAQFDRIAGKPVVVVGTTNYVRGIDTAIRRSGRFELKLPVLPPTLEDRDAIFRYYLSPERLREVAGLEAIDHEALAEETPLFTPADIKAVVEATLRRAIAATRENAAPVLNGHSLLGTIRRHQRSILRPHAMEWIAEARGLAVDVGELDWLENEVGRAYAE